MVLDLVDPSGWICIPLASNDLDLPSGPLRVHLLQLQVLGMHQNGRDTHVRQVGANRLLAIRLLTAPYNHLLAAILYINMHGYHAICYMYYNILIL